MLLFLAFCAAGILLGFCFNRIRAYRQRRQQKRIKTTYPPDDSSLTASTLMTLPAVHTRFQQPQRTVRPMKNTQNRIVLNPIALSRDRTRSELLLHPGQSLTILENFDDICLAYNPLTGESGLVPINCFLHPPRESYLPPYAGKDIQIVASPHIVIPANNDLPPRYKSSGL